MTTATAEAVETVSLVQLYDEARSLGIRSRPPELRDLLDAAQQAHDPSKHLKEFAQTSGCQKSTTIEDLINPERRYFLDDLEKLFPPQGERRPVQEAIATQHLPAPKADTLPGSHVIQWVKQNGVAFETPEVDKRRLEINPQPEEVFRADIHYSLEKVAEFIGAPPAVMADALGKMRGASGSFDARMHGWGVQLRGAVICDWIRRCDFRCEWSPVAVWRVGRQRANEDSAFRAALVTESAQLDGVDAVLGLIEQRAQQDANDENAWKEQAQAAYVDILWRIHREQQSENDQRELIAVMEDLAFTRERLKADLDAIKEFEKFTDLAAQAPELQAKVRAVGEERRQFEKDSKAKTRELEKAHRVAQAEWAESRQAGGKRQGILESRRYLFRNEHD